MAYVKTCGPRNLPAMAENADDVESIAVKAYGDRARVEGYTDEVHVYRLRRDGKRRDFVASYQAE